jgi:endonuclease YncB( thermonuclease family)
MGATGTVWDVEAVTKISDGDTIRARRTRVVDLDGRHFRQTDANPDGTPGDVSLRLAWVNTPERGKDGWAQAKADLAGWLADRTLPGGDGQKWPQGDLHVVCYQSAGWDRILADLIDANGQSASQWLMADRGWPPYTGAKA